MNSVGFTQENTVESNANYLTFLIINGFGSWKINALSILIAHKPGIDKIS